MRDLIKEKKENKFPIKTETNLERKDWGVEKKFPSSDSWIWIFASSFIGISEIICLHTLEKKY